MSAEQSLKRALSSIQDALSHLNRARRTDDAGAAREVKRAISELEGAETKIRQAIRDLPEE